MICFFLLTFTFFRYLLYDVNPGEGFNLRRDVYMRVAQVAKKLMSIGKHEWVLVLPPWGRIYHWKSLNVGPQIQLPWSLFFNTESLHKFVPVIEFEDFLTEIGDRHPQIDMVFYLQHYAEGWENSKWEERMDEKPCNDPPVYHQESENSSFLGWFWDYDNVLAKNFTCLSIQGYSSTLVSLLDKTDFKSVMIDRAEVILHDTFGDAEYWRVRRSMRFASSLCRVGDAFRKQYLNSTDTLDVTLMPNDWRLVQNPLPVAIGGPYMAIHLRRADFLYGHKEDVPSIRSAANQILSKLSTNNLTVVFIASDTKQEELDELKQLLKQVTLFYYKPSRDVIRKYKDGGIAIIDQWICSHARYFIGTHESTFSFRIQEEREILGFPPDTTFNCLCPENQLQCQQPSRWKIVY